MQQTANRKQVEFVFKIRALHCTPLEFRTGFLAGAFNLKVATVVVNKLTATETEES